MGSVHDKTPVVLSSIIYSRPQLAETNKNPAGLETIGVP